MYMYIYIAYMCRICIYVYTHVGMYAYLSIYLPICLSRRLQTKARRHLWPAEPQGGRLPGSELALHGSAEGQVLSSEAWELATIAGPDRDPK